MAKKQKEDIESLVAEENIVDCDLRDELPRSYMDYTMLSIIGRALPDVRDGLKPVQRRILYCCKEKGYDSNKPYIKNAKISGDVMGNYHPHSSCYGTIANMAQPWVYRYPLIDFHGNVGSIDGDSQASERYTEGRLAKTSYAILEDVLDKHCVEFRDNYSETLKEPIVLPGLFPNFLANGCPNAIAVGYTSCVPSHNLNEVCDGIIYAIKHNDFTLDDIMKIIKGPDFPYGSQMLKKGIKSLYETGEGSLSFRANYIIENNSENGNPQIVFTDMPPFSDKPKLIEKIHDMIMEKTLPRTISVRDESKGLDIRIVIECQKTANIPLLIKDLYDKTKLQANASFHMRGVLDKELKLVTLVDYIHTYISFRKEVLNNRYSYLVEADSKKLNIQKGLAKVIDDIKTAVNIIIDSETVDDAKKKLVSKYDLNEEQVNYILDQKTRSLVHKDREVIFKKIKELEDNLKQYNTYLTDDNAMKQLMIDQLNGLKKEFGDKRRTTIVSDFESGSTSSQEVSEDVYAVLYANGKINVYEEDEYQKFIDDKSYKDRTNLFIQANKVKRSDDLLIIRKTGMVERVPVNSLQYNNMKFEGAINFIVFNTESKKVLISVLKNGMVKKTLVNKMKFRINNPTQIIKDMESEIIINKLVDDVKDETITLATNNGCIGRFSVNSFVATASGAKAMPTCKLEENDFIVDCKISNASEDDVNKILTIFEWNDGSLGYKVMKLSDILVKGRTARALNYIPSKKFKNLLHIYIAKDNFVLLNNKNKEYTFDTYEVFKRTEKGAGFNKPITPTNFNN